MTPCRAQEGGALEVGSGSGHQRSGLAGAHSPLTHGVCPWAHETLTSYFHSSSRKWHLPSGFRRGSSGPEPSEHAQHCPQERAHPGHWVALAGGLSPRAPACLVPAPGLWVGPRARTVAVGPEHRGRGLTEFSHLLCKASSCPARPGAPWVCPARPRPAPTGPSGSDHGACQLPVTLCIYTENVPSPAQLRTAKCLSHPDT